MLHPDTAAAPAAARAPRAATREPRRRSAIPAIPAVPAEPEFLTAKEVQALLGLTRTRVYDLASSGRLPVVRFGRQVKFSRKAIDALHREGGVPAAPEGPFLVGDPAARRELEQLVERATTQSMLKVLDNLRAALAAA